MSFDWIHNALNSFQSCSFLSTHTISCSHSFPDPAKFSLCSPYIPGCVACHLSVVKLPVATLFKKMDSIFPRHYQLPVAPWVGLRFRVFLLFPCLYFVSPDLELCCACCSNYYEFIYVVAFLGPENTTSL